MIFFVRNPRANSKVLAFLHQTLQQSNFPLQFPGQSAPRGKVVPSSISASLSERNAAHRKRRPIATFSDPGAANASLAAQSKHRQRCDRSGNTTASVAILDDRIGKTSDTGDCDSHLVTVFQCKVVFRHNTCSGHQERPVWQFVFAE